MSPIDSPIDVALTHHRAGRLPPAESLYRQALAAEPGNVQIRSNLASVLERQGKIAEAIAQYEQAVALDPGSFPCHFNMGNLWYRLGDWEKAATAFQTACRVQPDSAQAANNLGTALLAMRQVNAAHDAFLRATQLQSDYAQAFNNLGIAAFEQHDLSSAQRALETAVTIDPQYAQAHYNLGDLFKTSRQYEQAEKSYLAALTADPQFAQAFNNLGTLYLEMEQTGDAVDCFDRAIAVDPAFSQARINRACGLHAQRKHTAAVEEYRRVLDADPNHTAALQGLSNVLKEQGRISEAIEACRQAIALEPSDAKTGSNLLLLLNHDPAASAEMQWEAHRGWANRHAPQVAPGGRQNVASGEERQRGQLRIGYVSPDFRNHAVANFLKPILRHHDPTSVEVYCYANLGRADQETDTFRRLCPRWRDIYGRDARVVAQQVIDDGIDILVDLAGHTANSRLDLFALRPAPVQATYLGYPNTTGMEQIDYRITDAITDPAESSDFYSEELIRPSDCFLVYEPPQAAPAVSELPMLTRGHVTFGAFQRLDKLNDRTIELWSLLLLAISNSRLLLKTPALDDPETAWLVLEKFRKQGVSERVELRGYAPSPTEHLATYQEIDVALDPQPYNGTTTTCEALWMGVPVLTRFGTTHVSRVTASLLHAVGLTEFIVQEQQSFVEQAKKVLGRPEQLSQLRSSLRDRMACSALCDAAGFTRNLETAYRQMVRARREK